VSYARGIDSYRRTQIQTQTPMELVVMLYDGALRFVREASAAIGRRDIAARQVAVSRALDIVSELQSTLNMAEGGEIAASLDRLYAFITDRITDASLKQDAAPLADAEKVLLNLRSAWAELAAQQTRPAAR